jgi:hypothetical protein
MWIVKSSDDASWADPQLANRKPWNVVVGTAAVHCAA